VQALWVTAVQLPVVRLNTRASTVPFGVVDGVCVGLWLLAFGIEFAADNTKFVFRAKPENRNKFITEGLWRYSRHPNYFGEILMWCAIAGMATWAAASGDDTQLYYSWASPALTAILLLRVSGVPMVEAAGEKKWGSDPAYRHYMSRTSLLVPWFPAPPLDGPAALPLSASGH
jgi:steroid 5-alpha reductase family enzyme